MRSDRVREPFARNRLRLRLRRPAGIDIHGTRGASHFFQVFLNWKKNHREERSQQPQPATQPIRQTMHRRRGRDTVEPLKPPASVQNPTFRKTGQFRTKRSRKTPTLAHPSIAQEPPPPPDPTPAVLRLTKNRKKAKNLQKPGISGQRPSFPPQCPAHCLLGGIAGLALLLAFGVLRRYNLSLTSPARPETRHVRQPCCESGFRR